MLRSFENSNNPKSDKELETVAESAISTQALIAGSLMGGTALAIALTFGAALPLSVIAFLAIGGSSAAYYNQLGSNRLSQYRETKGMRTEEIHDFQNAYNRLISLAKSEEAFDYDDFLHFFYAGKWLEKQEKRKLTLESDVKRAFFFGSAPFLSTTLSVLGFAIFPIPGLGLTVSIVGGFFAAGVSAHNQSIESEAVDALKERLKSLKPQRDELRYKIVLELLNRNIKNLDLDVSIKTQIIDAINETSELNRRQDLINYLIIKAKERNDEKLNAFINTWIPRLNNPLVPPKINLAVLKSKNPELARKIEKQKNELCNTTKQEVACVAMGVILGTLAAAGIGAILVTGGVAIVPAMIVAAAVLIPAILISHYLYRKEAFKEINQKIDKINRQFDKSETEKEAEREANAQREVKKKNSIFNKMYNKLPNFIKKLKPPSLSIIFMATMLGVISLAISPLVPFAALGVLVAGAIIIGVSASGCEVNIKVKEAELDAGEVEMKLWRFEASKVENEQVKKEEVEEEREEAPSEHMDMQPQPKEQLSQLRQRTLFPTPSPSPSTSKKKEKEPEEEETESGHEKGM